MGKCGMAGGRQAGPGRYVAELRAGNAGNRRFQSTPLIFKVQSVKEATEQ